ncbi:Predicted oxidoreductase [Leifsonia sp. 98AMF]|uniref:aldo/keto reductase n=1 Tax=unclassified Leifsonia TaxID=2663824 RepID=UPI00087D6CBA|nr:MULTISPECIES: aldo/keto reductase [unclassified Leifsonia]SDH08355.1 Predicted oxidoreductase [Leifsonia sp. 197AMF]SDJ31475.1 Predicted oxidoreductase [Leifsonia sp. 466MF]SDK48592.1 Predicted oxidoreductase [Leifsonia sp. 157MF]SDN52836.1 Predicted oxidoreductase [Leifsonia sp. 509MF]SEN57277.1 Predicted oxidoreductase [Leifsonia sp. 467MF]
MTDTTIRPGGTFALGGREVARVGYGAMSLERYEDDRETGAALLRRAAELGIDHVDTADFYGASVSNDIIRRAFGDSDTVAIATKVGAVRVDAPVPLALAQRPAELRAQVEDNLRTLGRSRLDVVNLRRPEVGPGLTVPVEELVDLDDQLAELIALRDDGLIGAIGLSAVGASTLRRALPAGIACVQNAYSLLSREHEDLLALCLAEGIAWVPFFPLGSGFAQYPKVADDPTVRRIATETGATPAQVGLAWLLAHAANVLLIPGTASVPHLEENVAAGALVLTAEQLAELDAVAGATAGPSDSARR